MVILEKEKYFEVGHHSHFKCCALYITVVFNGIETCQGDRHK